LDLTNIFQIGALTPTSHNDTYEAISPLNPANSLKGKSVFITGASKGIGRMTAIRYAQAGCSKIGISARSVDLLHQVSAEIQAAASAAGHHDTQVLAVELDVTSPAAVRQAAQTVSAKFNDKLDIFIANAGFLKNVACLPHETDADYDDDWWETFVVNVRGTHLCAKYFIPLLLLSETKGLFLEVTSVGAHGIVPGASAYGVSKFASTRLVESLAHEYAHLGLTVVAVHPGGVKTELAMGTLPKYQHWLVDTVELPADSMVWLAAGAPRSREWLSGRYYSVWWDVTELEAKKGEIVEGDLLKFRMTV